MSESKFKVGNFVKIRPDSEYYLDGDKLNPKDEIGTVVETDGSDYVSVLWVAGRNCYGDHDLELTSLALQTETQPTELEEAYAKIDTLESALEDAVKEVLSLKHQLIAKAANTCLGIEKEEPEFKPISEYTLEDWELAIDNNWEFELRSGEVVQVDELYPSNEVYVVSLNKCTQTITGKVCDWNEEHEDDVVKRIK